MDKNFSGNNRNEIDSQNFNKHKEEDVGISEFIYKSNLGFNCVLKHRYSDFLVNEIDMEGNVVWMKTPKTEDDKSKPKLEDEPTSKDEVDLLIEKNFLESRIINNPDDLEKMKKFLFNYFNEQSNNSLPDEDFIFIEFIEDKNLRKSFHEKIREVFPFLETETLNEGQVFKPRGTSGNSSKKKTKRDERSQESQGIASDSASNRKSQHTSDKKQIVLFVNKNQNNFYRRRKNFPDNKKWLHVVMLKRNYDTVQAVGYIARILHRSSKTIKFAGNKDKRGITTQKISIFSTLPEEITNLTKQKFWDKRIELGNFEFKEEELRLGLLKGNQFSVVFRFLKLDGINNDNMKNISIEEEIEKCVNSIKEKGFINYFGMQRFGVSTIPTHKIGINVIKKQWKEAIINILNTQLTADALRQAGMLKNTNSSNTSGNTNPNDNFQIIASALEHPEKINDLLKILPKYSMEYKILSCQRKTGKNAYLTCFKTINRQLQVLYPHAYQSYIWNKTVSDRIRFHGLNLLTGDIVKKKSGVVKEEVLDIIVDTDDVVNFDENEGDDKNENEEELLVSKQPDGEKADKIFENNYEYITEENINNYTFDDLYLPMVGYQVKYPKNDTFAIISNYVEQDGIKLEDFAYQNVNFNSTGYFRKVVEKPNEIKYEIIYHDDPDEDLQNEYYNVDPHPNPKGELKKYVSLRLQFQLTQCTYATMLFRELTKKSSSTYYQANLSKNFK
jgi:tRNA pseudouridine13 synthase